jgi:hypothetical protein
VAVRLQQPREDRPDLLLVVDDEDTFILVDFQHAPFIGRSRAF